MTLLLMLLALLILLALRVPVGIALLVPSIIYIAFDPSSSPALAVQQATSGVFDFAILAVPMFILLGNLANISGATDRLYDAAVAAIGHVRGSLGYVNILTSFGFSWVSGAAISDAAAMGRIQVPAMIRRGYPVGLSLGVTGASSLIAPMMPPSIPAIIYAVTAGVSVGALFVAGIVPAVLLVITLSIMCWFLTRKREDLRLPKADLGERVRSGLRALPPVGAAVVILGGILSGVFTPTEASAVGVAYIGILAIVYGNFTWPKVRHALVTAVETTGGVLIIVAGAALFGWVLAREQAPQLAADVLLSITDRPIVFLILVNVLLLIIGCVLEPTSAILILVPVLLPVAEVFGLSPVHFGIMIIFNLLIGLLTPPVGLVLFVLSSVTKYPVTTVIKGTLPFFVPMLATLVLISVVPFLSLWLPSLLGYPV
ncbi:TRAP transporter large permease [Brevibacterium casei]|uniref:Sialic acid TRAP transporter large permease SiaM n=2 Tax=Brevibacterium TaxID=1696 RepID=A0ABN0SM41_9MICO|nr:TRAP transporter large permease [Brevibacterium casei]MCT2184222.1 TRAP transporter large permease [Brevibacterium casei]MCT2356840.1 TRAP transporter large permease [Brevibacterium casei]MDH5148977.1 TRAP transporter large permease [Brevibacterium casei]